MDFRNPVYNRAGTIDMEINHPDFGWIPFTADPDETLGKELYDLARKGTVAPYVEPPPSIPDSVSSRQFKLQLLATGILAEVEAYVAAQGQAVKIAYDNSGSFVRDEPMMQSGFAQMGLTAQQIDAFFVAASKL